MKKSSDYILSIFSDSGFFPNRTQNEKKCLTAFPNQLDCYEMDKKIACVLLHGSLGVPRYILHKQ